jgi:chromosome segregation ATPase
MDGYVIIGTQLDTKQLEQDLKNAKKELTSFQKEEEKLLKEKGKIELDLAGYDEEKTKIQANTDELLKKAETEEQITNVLNMENSELENLTAKYSKQFTSLEEINGKLKENQINQGLVNNKIDEANTKLSQAKGYNKVKEEINSINDKMSSVIKKVGKWALAVFSVRSAYNLIRQASSTLSQYNEQYATDLEYIKYALAQAIAPVLEYLVKLAYQLLTYVNYIAKAWFGKNLFENASKNFKSMASSASSIKKSLQATPFDEMNILSDTSTSTSGGVSTPSVDLSQIEDNELPQWLENIINLFTLLGSVIAGIKFGNLLNKLGLVGEIKFYTKIRNRYYYIWYYRTC